MFILIFSKSQMFWFFPFKKNILKISNKLIKNKKQTI